MTATFVATIDLSTTGSRREDASSKKFLDGAEVEIVQDGLRLALGERPVVTFEERHTVAEDPVGQARRRFVQQHQINPVPRAADPNTSA